MDINGSDILEKNKLKCYQIYEIAEVIVGKKMKIFTNFSIIIYLTGLIASKTILASHTLSSTFKNIDILQEFDFWLAFFVTISALFSFKDISNTKKL